MKNPNVHQLLKTDLKTRTKACLCKMAKKINKNIKEEILEVI